MPSDPEIGLISPNETIFDKARLVARNLLQLTLDRLAAASAIFKVATGLERHSPLTPREQAAVALPEDGRLHHERKPPWQKPKQRNQ